VATSKDSLAVSQGAKGADTGANADAEVDLDQGGEEEAKVSEDESGSSSEGDPDEVTEGEDGGKESLVTKRTAPQPQPPSQLATEAPATPAAVAVEESPKGARGEKGAAQEAAAADVAMAGPAGEAVAVEEASGVGVESAVPPPLPAPGRKKVLTKKEKRRLRREAKEREAKVKRERALKSSGIQEGEAERMESDPEASEDSAEEVVESYFDLVKQFQTKKTLPVVDHTKIDYKPFRKNLYIQVKEITNMKDHEVEDLRKTHGEIRVRGRNCPRPITSFLQCGLPERVMKILDKRDYETPFPIQMQAIPALMCGRDVIGVAQTGSGKTLAYVLPCIRHVMDQPRLADGDGPIGFMIAPTRELALQISRECQVFCKAAGLASVCAFGGGPMGEQLSALKKGCEILVGTPGRLIDVLCTSNGKITNLRRVTFFVLDEADRMFDMGFEPQIGMFLQTTRPDKQVALFSATLPTHVEALARTVLKKPLEIIVGERNTAATNVTQFIEVLEESQKFYRLLQLLGEWHDHGACIIFVHTQRDVDEMFTELLKFGYPALALHGGQDQHDRDFTLQDFKDGVANILVATSVAARGIDVKKVILVVNFKVPDHLEDYIHRVGRTGRAGKAGFAFTFIQPDEADRAQDMLDALRFSHQHVPEVLKRLAEEHQSLVNLGQAVKRKRWGGFGGKGYKFDNTEKSRQQKDRANAKRAANIGDDNDDEEENVKDPWLEDNINGKKKEPAQQAASSGGSDPQSTAAAAAERAAAMGAQAVATASSGKATPVSMPPPPVPGSAGVAKATATPAAKAPLRKSDKELEEQAQKMAEETLSSLSEEQREKLLPALRVKLKEKLAKADEAQAAPARAPAPPPPPASEQSAVMKALPSVPGVLQAPGAAGGPEMVQRSIQQLQSAALQPVLASTVADALERVAVVQGTQRVLPPGMHMEELDINDYPQVARQKISHKDPLLQIEEMTGAKVQVRGQYFAPNATVPEGSRRLFVEITGPTVISVQKGKAEVHKMMEALAIRTLNIPGVSRAVMGSPGRYDPIIGK